MIEPPRVQSHRQGTDNNDQGVFTSLIEQLGVKDVQFEELFSLDAESIRALR